MINKSCFYLSNSKQVKQFKKKVVLQDSTRFQSVQYNF